MPADIPLLQIAQIVPATRAEGPGVRSAVWFQGCPLRCPECCNPEMLPFNGGTEVPLRELIDQIDRAHEKHSIEGITLLGGEPFAHAAGAAELAKQVSQRGLSVMVFTGYELTSLQTTDDIAFQHLLDHTDLLIDGPYDRNQPDTSRRWVGSTNQGIHFLTDRYASDDSYWSEPDTLEIRLRAGEVTVNGFPATHARMLWKLEQQS